MLFFFFVVFLLFSTETISSKSWTFTMVGMIFIPSSSNHRITKAERNTKIIQSNQQSMPVTALDHVPRCSIYHFFFNTSGNSKSTTSMGSLCQCLTTLRRISS